MSSTILETVRVPYKEGATRRASIRIGVTYDQAHTYRRGETMIHPTFGEGEVTAVIDHKIDVLFSDRMRRLIIPIYSQGQH